MVTILFYIANEALSVVENCAAMGVLVPKQLAERLAVIKMKEVNHLQLPLKSKKK